MNKQKRSDKRVLFIVISFFCLCFTFIATRSRSDGPWPEHITKPFLEEITLSLQGPPAEKQCREANDRLLNAFKKQRFTSEFTGYANFLHGAARVCLGKYSDSQQSKDFYFNNALDNLVEAERMMPNYSPAYFLEGFILYLHYDDYTRAERKVQLALQYDPQFAEAKDLLDKIRDRIDQGSLNAQDTSPASEDKPTEFTPIPFE